MLTSIAVLLIIGLISGRIVTRFRLPALLGYLITGVVLGPYLLDFLADSLLEISSDLRRIALVVILTRAGLTLNISDLKQAGRPALLMCFVPAIFEMCGALVFGQSLLGFNWAQSLLMGSILAAVSPAVLVPRTIEMIQTGLGVDKQIPQILLMGASADDVFVYTVFAMCLDLNTGDTIGWGSLIDIPVTLTTGLVVGLAVGWILTRLYQWQGLNQTHQAVVSVSVGFLLFALEDFMRGFIGFSAVLAIIASHAVILKQKPNLAKNLANNFQPIWQVFEIFLFALLGASVNPNLALKYFWPALFFITGCGLFRAVGVLLSMVKTSLSLCDRIFMVLAYIPKATEQAAIGGIPFAMGIIGGDMMLVVATLSIFYTAPLGAFLVDYFAPRWLNQKSA